MAAPTSKISGFVLLCITCLCFFACQNKEEVRICFLEDSPQEILGIEPANGLDMSAESTTVDKKKYRLGQVIDQYNGVPIYYNRDTYNSMGRHIAEDGYNYGMKWQCVEFVKRYYYDHLHHAMPDTYGHAKHFFLRDISDGAVNISRNLRQFKNGGVYRPQVNDILVFEGKHYGHVAIVSRVLRDQIEIVQQNVGVASRHKIKLYHSKGRYYIMNKAVLGWLGKR